MAKGDIKIDNHDIMDTQNTVGRVDNFGRVHVPDGVFHEHQIGRITDDAIYSNDGKRVADISKSGNVYSTKDSSAFSYGKQMGNIADDGTLRDVKGCRIGEISGGRPGFLSANFKAAAGVHVPALDGGALIVVLVVGLIYWATICTFINYVTKMPLSEESLCIYLLVGIALLAELVPVVHEYRSGKMEGIKDIAFISYIAGAIVLGIFIAYVCLTSGFIDKATYPLLGYMAAAIIIPVFPSILALPGLIIVVPLSHFLKSRLNKKYEE